MKLKLFALVLAVALTGLLSRCTGRLFEEKNYEDMQTYQDATRVEILRGDLTYSFYGFVSDASLTGEQIGILDGDRDHRVYAVVGYPDSDWLVTYLDVLMGGTTHSLYKRVGLDEVPEDFVLDDGDNSHFLRNYL